MLKLKGSQSALETADKIVYQAQRSSNVDAEFVDEALPSLPLLKFHGHINVTPSPVLQKP